MKDFLLGLDRQILDAISIGRNFRLPAPYRKVSNILFCGMGGSALSGDILNLLSNRHSSIPFQVNRSSRMPAWINNETLVIFSSYSGNTEEIVQDFTRASAVHSKMLVVTSGGKLSELAAQKKNILCLMIPGGLPPRCAVGYLTFSLLPVLSRQGWMDVPEADMKEAAVQVGLAAKKAPILAQKLAGKFVHFYGLSGLMEPVLTRWRAQFAENAKTLASSHLIPEMFHNEIEGWQFPSEIIKRSLAVFFLDREYLAPLKKKIAFVQKKIKQRGGDAMEISSSGRSLVGRIFSLIGLGDWVSFELAKKLHVDPKPIPTIEELKKI